MRIEKLNNDKVKVTLTTTDLLKFDIDIEALSPNSKELHNFLFHIMETIREETGFNPYNGQVVVEATPQRDGIIIVVSKIKNIRSRAAVEEIKKRVHITAKPKKTADSAIFYFDVFDNLCSALLLLERSELLAGELYKLNETFCYILNNYREYPRCGGLMTEFASETSLYPLQHTYIKEHGKLIAKGESLVNMARNLEKLV